MLFVPIFKQRACTKVFFIVVFAITEIDFFHDVRQWRGIPSDNQVIMVIHDDIPH